MEPSRAPNLEDLDRSLNAALSLLTCAQLDELVEHLAKDYRERAEVIGRLHQAERSRTLAELLIDLEAASPGVRTMFRLESQAQVRVRTEGGKS